MIVVIERSFRKRLKIPSFVFIFSALPRRCDPRRDDPDSHTPITQVYTSRLEEDTTTKEHDMKVLLAVCLLFTLGASAQTPAGAHMERGGTIFITPMQGFETYLTAAILKKKVPLVVVGDQTKADYILSGTSAVEKAGWAKTIFVSPSPHAQASIQIKNSKTGAIVFAYSVDKNSAVRADQSTAESCAKHMKDAIEK
jgi:hypothetical protein